MKLFQIPEPTHMFNALIPDRDFRDFMDFTQIGEQINVLLKDPLRFAGFEFHFLQDVY